MPVAPVAVAPVAVAPPGGPVVAAAGPMWGPGYPRGVRRSMLHPRWLALHLLAIVLTVAFLALGWWQLGRGEAGNLRSYAYALEWPTFALFVLFMWWRVIRDSRADTTETAGMTRPAPDQTVNPGSPAGPSTGVPATVGRSQTDGPGTGGAPDQVPLPRVLTRHRRPAPAPGTDEPDEQLAAYNRYLADLHARDRQQTR
ncbi:MAG TPA: hypothetical protein VIR27_04145 [Mycobacteriales bacterium]